jgi:hypothetical protein
MMMKLLFGLKRFDTRVLLTGLLINASHFCSAAIMPGDLLITEVMTNPAAVSDTNGEWFEIFNNTSTNIDINGLVISDNGSNLHTVDNGGSLWIGAGSYFVLGRDANALSNGGYQADYIYTNFTLGNTSDAIILTLLDVVIDSLVYDTSTFTTAGNSAEWTGSGFSLTPDSFIYGNGDIGTPGTAGSVNLTSPVPLPASGWLMFTALSGLFLRRKNSNTI